MNFFQNFKATAQAEHVEGEAVSAVEKRFVFPVLLFAAFAASLLSSLNPFSRALPWIDSSVFLAIGEGMRKGMVPYLDFFDHKGPLLYLINYIGLCLGGKTGVWVLELIFLIVSILFAYKSARFFASWPAALVGTLCVFTILPEFFMKGNMVEEYALPFIFISLYIYTENFLKGRELGWGRVFILGVCFGATLLLKPNLFAVWACFSFVVFMLRIREKKYNSAAGFVFWFGVGTVAVAIPFLFYLWVRGAMVDFFDQYVLFNGKYAASGGGVFRFAANVLLSLNRPFVFPVLLLVFYRISRTINTRESLFHVVCSASILLTILLCSATSYSGAHYCTTLLPLFVPAMAWGCWKLFELAAPFKPGIIRVVLICSILGIAFNLQIRHGASEVYSILNPGRTRYDPYSDDKLRRVTDAVANRISEADEMIVLGSNCNLYSCASVRPATRYIYQWPIGEISPEIAERFQSDVLAKKPALIILSWPYVRVTPKLEMDMGGVRRHFPRVTALLESDYEQVFAENGLAVVFERKKKRLTL